MGTVDGRMQAVFRMVLGDATLVLDDTTTAVDVEGWDSLAHINLMFSLENEFDIQFVGNEFACFTTFGELRLSLESKLAR